MGMAKVFKRCPFTIDDLQCALYAGHEGLHIPGGDDGDDEPDMVNQPPHYTHSAVEPIDAIEAWGLNYRLGQVVKYVARHEHKGSALQDLEKARWYLDREIAKRREAGGAE